MHLMSSEMTIEPPRPCSCLGDGHHLLAELGTLLNGANMQAAVGDPGPWVQIWTNFMPILEAMNISGDADLSGVADEGQGAVLDLLALGEVLEHGHEVAHLLRGMVEPDMPLMTGAVEPRRGRRRPRRSTRAIMMSSSEPITRAVSPSDS